MVQKSYDDSPTLYIVPTPIGNMEDMTIRGINILKNSDIIFSEDTRETGNLLNYFDISGAKLISSHKFNENDNLDKVIKYLKDGKKVSLVSDRGTPAISDPGYSLVREVVKKGFNVVCLPGATAFVPAIVMSGFNTEKFLFYGFLNSKTSKQLKELDTLKMISYPIIFYESPHRIKMTLNNIQTVFGNRKIAIAREISKKFEEVIRDDIDKIILNLPTLKGEFVIVVEGNEGINAFSELSIIDHVNIYVDLGYSSKEAIKIVSKERHISKSEVYNEYHR